MTDKKYKCMSAVSVFEVSSAFDKKTKKPNTKTKTQSDSDKNQNGNKNE